MPKYSLVIIILLIILFIWFFNCTLLGHLIIYALWPF